MRFRNVTNISFLLETFCPIDKLTFHNMNFIMYLQISHKFFGSFFDPLCLIISWHDRAMAEVISNVVLRLSKITRKSHRPKFSKQIAQYSTTSVLGRTESFVCKHASQASARACLSMLTKSHNEFLNGCWVWIYYLWYFLASHPITDIFESIKFPN